MRRLLLASQSPRRSEILTQHGFEFSVCSVQISEIPDENLNLTEQICDIALRKALACFNLRKSPISHDNLIISADTVVVLDGQILGKPKDRQENRQQLERLSGRSHEVITAISLVDPAVGEVIGREPGQIATDFDVAKIQFRELSNAEIDSYVASGDGLDKAGGYGIQGSARQFVARLDGDFETVVGLSTALIERMLLANRWQVARAPLVALKSEPT